jgi:uncharacterized membrane protein
MSCEKPEETMNKRDFLLQEAEKWREEGIITEEQLCRIKDRYPEPPKTNSLPFFAAILIGLGVLTFIASNWGELGAITKLVIILAGMTAAYVGGEIARRRGYDKTGLALTAVGVMIYGAGFFLIGQMYHLSANPVNAFYLWLVGAVAMTWLYRSPFLAFLSVLIWFVSALYGADSGDRDGQKIVLFYLLFVCAIAPLIWRFRSRWVVLPSLLVLYAYALYDVRHIGEGMAFPAVLVALLLIAQLLPKSAEMIAQTMRTLSYLGMMLTGMFVIFNEDGLLDKITPVDTLLAGGVVVTAALYGYLTVRNGRTDLLADIIPPSGFLVIYLLQYSETGILGLDVASVLMIVVLFLFSIAVVTGGEKRRDVARINWGAVFFGLTCLAGYVNFAWEFLDKSLFFLIGGILLLGLSFVLERQRRKWVSDARREQR